MNPRTRFLISLQIEVGNVLDLSLHYGFGVQAVVVPFPGMKPSWIGIEVEMKDTETNQKIF